MRIGGANAAGDAFISIIPGDALKAVAVFFANEREGEATKLAEFGVGKFFEAGDVVEEGNVQFRCGVEAEEIQARHAKMRALDGPIVKASDAQGATITDTAAKDFPGVGEIVPVLPDDRGHVAEVARLPIEQAKWNEPFPTGAGTFLDLAG